MLFCLVRKIVPAHCTTILKTTFEEIRFWPWKCQISFKIPNIMVDATIVEFCKGLLDGDRLIIKTILYIRVA